MKPDPNLRPVEVAETRMQNGSGNLVANRSKITDADPDLIGSVSFDGRLIRLRGWVIETEFGAHIRLTVQR